MYYSPLEQFSVFKLISLNFFNIIDISFTNSSMMMVISILLFQRSFFSSDSSLNNPQVITANASDNIASDVIKEEEGEEVKVAMEEKKATEIDEENNIKNTKPENDDL